jgi:hypothetical protein
MQIMPLPVSSYSNESAKPKKNDRTELGMRESGYSLSPLYLKPVLIVGRSVCVCVCVCLSVRRYLECLYIYKVFRYLREFVKGDS